MLLLKKKLLASTLGLSLFSCVSIAEEIDEIESIIIYGAISAAPLTEMATSISVLTDHDIEQRQAQHLEDLLNRAANVNFASGASRGRFIQIRGIGERSQFVDPINPSVGFLVDGINYSGMLAGASTFDVAQIEIFKGPNSTRFGADGLAGMINVISEEPTEQTDFAAQLGIGNYNSWNVGAALGGAISESVQYRVSVQQNNSDGFIKNQWLEREDTNGIDELSARAKVNWQASENLQINTVFHLIDVDNGYDAFSLDRNRTTLSDEPGFDKQESEALGISFNYQGMDWANLQLKLSHLQADLGYGYDEDWSYVGIAPGWEYSSTDHYFRDRKDNSIEAKLLGKTDTQNTWVLGFYYADKNEDLKRDFFDFGIWADAVFNSEVDRKDAALFAQYKHMLSDTQWITSSLRLASQDFHYTDSQQITENIDDNNWGAELSFHQKAGDNSLIYLSLLRSYKMGGVNGQALGKLDDAGLEPFRQVLLDNAVFDGESLIGVEFGVKGRNQDGSFTVDLSTFYQWRDEVQYKNSIVQDQSFVDFYNNAAQGTNYGLEVAINVVVSESLSTFLNIGWLKTDIEGITRQDGSIVDSRDQAHAPQFQVNWGGNWQLTNELSWLFEADVKDDFYYSFSHDQRSSNVFIVHTSLDLELGRWQISLYAKNLFDKEYANRGFYFGNDPRDEYAPDTYEQFGEPRRIGINFKYHY
jgi:outer membrane receptor protein involved in Fe transport